MDKTSKIIFEAILNATSLKAGSKEVKSILEDLEKSFNNSSKTTNASAEAQKIFNKTINDNSQSIKKQSQEFNLNLSSIKSQIDSTNNLSSSLRTNAQIIQHQINVLREQKRSIKSNSDEDKLAKKIIDENISALRHKKLEIEKQIILNNQLKNSLKEASNATNQHNSTLGKLSAAFSLATLAGNTMANALSAGVSLVKTQFHELYEEFIHLQDKILQMQGLFGDGVGGFKELSNQIIDVANDMGKGSIEATDSIKKFMPIVDDLTNSIEAYKQAQIAATATKSSLSTFTKLDVALIKSYGAEVKDLATFHNHLAVAAKYAKVPVSDLADNFPTVAIRAASAGISARKSAVEFAVLTNALKSAPQAATNYSQLINKIENPTKEMIDRIEELNKKTGSSIKFGASAIREAGGSVMDWLKPLREALEKTKDSNDDLIKSFKLTQAQKALQGLMAADRPDEKRSDKKSIMQRALEESKTNTKQLQNMYNKAIESIENRINTLIQTTKNYYMRVMVDMEPLFQRGIDYAEYFFNFAINAFDDFVNYAKQLFGKFERYQKQGFSTNFLDIFSEALKVCIALIRNFTNLGVNAFNTFMTVFDFMTQEIASRVITPIANLKEIIRMAKDDMNDFFSDMVAHPIDFWTSKNKKTYFNRINDFFEGQNDLIKDKMKNMHQAFGQLVQSFRPKNLFNTEFEFSNKKYVSTRPNVKVEEASNNELIAKELLKHGDIQLNYGRDKNNNKQAKKDASLLEKYTSLRNQLLQEIKVIEEDNTLEKAISKINAKYFKLRDNAEKDLKKAKDTNTRKSIIAYISQTLKNQIADIKTTKKEFQEKANEVLNDIENVNKDLKQRIKDIQNGDNFASIFALNDFNANFNKDNKYEKLLEKFGYSKKDAEKAVKSIEDNIKLLDKKSREAFEKAKKDLNNKILQKDSVSLANSATDLKEEALRTKKAKSEEFGNFKASIEEEKVIIKERLKTKLNEIQEEKEAKELQIREDIEKQKKLGATEEELKLQLNTRLLSLDKEYQNIKSTAELKAANDKIALEVQITDKINQINKDSAKNIVDSINSILDPIFPGIGKIFDTIIDKNKNLREDLLKTFGLFRNETGNLIANPNVLNTNSPKENKSTGNLSGVSSELQGFINETNTGFDKLINNFDLSKSEINSITKFTNNLSSSFKGASENVKESTSSMKDFSVEMAGIQIVIQQVTKALDVAWTEAKKALTGQLKTAEDLQESQMNMAKAMPGGVGFIAELIDIPRQRTKIEKEENEKRLQSTFELNQEKLKNEVQTSDKLIEIATNEYNHNLELLNKESKDEVIKNNEREKLTLEHEKNITNIKEEALKRQADAYFQLQEQLVENSFKIEDKLNYNNLLFVKESIQALIDAKGDLKLYTDLLKLASLKKTNSDNSAKFGEEEKNIKNQETFLRSKLALNEESKENNLAIARSEYDEYVKILESKLKFGLISVEDYNNEIFIKNNELAKKNKDIQEKYNKDIQALNQKNYDIIKDLKTKQSQKEIDSLKSQIDKEIDLIKNKNKRLQDLEDERNQVQSDKDKRRIAFSQALASNTKNEDFYRANPKDFESGTNGLTNRKNKLQDLFDIGQISSEAFNKAMSGLGIEQYQFYIDKMNYAIDPEQAEEFRQKAMDGQKLFFQYIFDAQKEKIENETKAAEKQLEIDKKNLKILETEQEKVIANLDSKFKDSSGEMKNNYVSDFRSFISDISPDIEKLGVDLYNTLKSAKEKFSETDKEAQKLGITSTVTNTPKSPMSSPAYDTSTTPKQGETWDDMIARYKKEDAEVSKNIVKTNTSNNVVSNPYSAKPQTNTQIEERAQVSDMIKRSKIFRDMVTNSPSYDFQYFEKKYGYMSTKELEDLARLRGIPGYKTGIDNVPETQFALLHKGEAVLNEYQAEIHRKGLNRTNNNYQNSTTVVNLNLQQNFTANTTQDLKKEMTSYTDNVLLPRLRSYIK